MKRQVKKTGPFGVGAEIHTVVVADAVEPVIKFYEEVFGAVVFMGIDEPSYSPSEDRWASLAVISDFCIEVMAPNEPVDPTKPIGKFYTKFGSHLHSVGFEVDDLIGLGNELIAKGLYIGKPGGGQLEKMPDDATYFYPSPGDTGGLMVQLTGFSIPGDPRLLDTWSSQIKQWEQIHPMGIQRLAYQTLGVRDLDAAVGRYKELFAVESIAQGVSDAEQARYEIVEFGDTLLRIAEPIDSESALGQHVAKWKNMIYSITFKVNELDTAQAWLTAKNVRSNRLSDDLLAADPSDTFNAPFLFTTEDIPNDPFE
jgi:hypothetical protein